MREEEAGGEGPAFEEVEVDAGGVASRRGRTFRRNCLPRAVRIPPCTKVTERKNRSKQRFKISTGGSNVKARGFDVR